MHLDTDRHATITSLLTKLYRLDARQSGKSTPADPARLIHTPPDNIWVTDDESAVDLLRTAAALDRQLSRAATDKRPKPEPWHVRIHLPTFGNDHPGAVFSDNELRALARRVTFAARLDVPQLHAHRCHWIAVRTQHTLHLVSPAVTQSGVLLDRADLTMRARRDVEVARSEIQLQDNRTPGLPRDGTIVLRTRATGVVTAEGCDPPAERALIRIGMRPVALRSDTPWMRTPYGTVPAALPGYAAHANHTLTALGYHVDQRADATRRPNRAHATRPGQARTAQSAKPVEPPTQRRR
ncbi:hypothetical protein LO772_29675 [Yinghuangia sp. ASG 101]|uniref:hypothetical protein n=1 Tax=Yinghuangia sp. ASG 101 TaxID=2896848 RepID=UPI001E332C5C|nr:hypothetical protein [Yinghuangia sp. ASG 101]UGQ10938.1 hypothetical protein LO772_29675 [Yinghuangia sp. ASG 101]